MTALTRESILNATHELAREELFVPEFGGELYVRMMTGTERDKLEVEWEKTERVNFRGRLVVATACDASGRNLFLPADIPSVGRKPAAALQRICQVAFRINRFSQEEIQELEKNSENGRHDDSP